MVNIEIIYVYSHIYVRTEYRFIIKDLSFIRAEISKLYEQFYDYENLVNLSATGYDVLFYFHGKYSLLKK